MDIENERYSMKSFFYDLLEERGISLSPLQRQQFHMYYKQLLKWNKKMNLTAIVDEKSVYLRHFYDSLSLSFYHSFSKEQSVCDVGAGAGFPSLPLKICFPCLQITIVDALQKRLLFLKSLTRQLGLEPISLYHTRAECFGKNRTFRESFDVVAARAVANLPVLSEYCLPLVRMGGLFMAMKGAEVKDELESSTNAIQILGGQLETVYSFNPPDKGGKRHVLCIRKKIPTPDKFPRKPGRARKSPL